MVCGSWIWYYCEIHEPHIITVKNTSWFLLWKFQSNLTHWQKAWLIQRKGPFRWSHQLTSLVRIDTGWWIMTCQSLSTFTKLLICTCHLTRFGNCSITDSLRPRTLTCDKILISLLPTFTRIWLPLSSPFLPEVRRRAKWVTSAWYKTTVTFEYDISQDLQIFSGLFRNNSGMHTSSQWVQTGDLVDGTKCKSWLLALVYINQWFLCAYVRVHVHAWRKDRGQAESRLLRFAFCSKQFDLQINQKISK